MYDARCRFQESTNRLTVKFTAAEGTAGNLAAYVIPAMPPKTCARIDVPLLPLCLHQLVSSPGMLQQQQQSRVAAGAAAAGAGRQQLGVEAGAVLLEQLQNERPFSELVLQGGCGIWAV